MYMPSLKSISEKCRKKSGKLRKISNVQKWSPKSENFCKNGIYVETDTSGHLCTKFAGFILIYEAMIAKKWVWPFCASKVGQSVPITMKLKLNMSWHLLSVYIPSFKLISQSMLKKVRVDGHCHGIIRTFFKRPYKNDQHMTRKKNTIQHEQREWIWWRRKVFLMQAVRLYRLYSVYVAYGYKEIPIKDKRWLCEHTMYVLCAYAQGNLMHVYQ